MVGGVQGISPSNFGASGGGGAAQAFQEITTAAGQFANMTSITGPEANNFLDTTNNLICSYRNDPNIQALVPALGLLTNTLPSSPSVPIAPTIQIYARMIANCMSRMTYNPNMNTQDEGAVTTQMQQMSETIFNYQGSSPYKDLPPQLISQMSSMISEYPNNSDAQSMRPILTFLQMMYDEHLSQPSNQNIQDMIDKIFNIF